MQYRVLRGHFSESFDGYHWFRAGQIVEATEDQSEAGDGELHVVGVCIMAASYGRPYPVIGQCIAIEDLELVQDIDALDCECVSLEDVGLEGQDFDTVPAAQRGGYYNEEL
jgi:hypothetical protein